MVFRLTGDDTQIYLTKDNGFESSLCSPYAGHEKGAVEAKVGMVRRKLFVPRPSVWNLENFNSRLPDRCLELGGKPHHAKD